MSSFTSRGNCRPLHDPQITSLRSNTHNLNLDHPLHFPRTNKHRDHSTQRDQSSTKPSRQPAILQPRTNVARRTRQTWLLHHQPEPRDFANTLPPARRHRAHRKWEVCLLHYEPETRDGNHTLPSARHHRTRRDRGICLLKMSPCLTWAPRKNTRWHSPSARNPNLAR